MVALQVAEIHALRVTEKCKKMKSSLPLTILAKLLREVPRYKTKSGTHTDTDWQTDKQTHTHTNTHTHTDKSEKSHVKTDD